MLVEPCHWLPLSPPARFLPIKPTVLYQWWSVAQLLLQDSLVYTGSTWLLPAVLNRQIRTILLGIHFGLSHWYLPSSGWSLYSPLLLPTLIPLGYQVLDIYNGKVLINHNILISCEVG